VLFAALSYNAVRVIAGDLPRGNQGQHVLDTTGYIRDVVRYASALCDQSLKAQMPTHDSKTSSLNIEHASEPGGEPGLCLRLTTPASDGVHPSLPILSQLSGFGLSFSHAD
jgi:hypothetical protein